MPDSSMMREELPLDFIGIEEATDKSSLVGDYLRHYERVLSPMRDDEFNLIEIGVYRGGSCRSWERFFSRARIVGVDIDPRCREHATDRVVIEIGSQNDPDFCTGWSPRTHRASSSMTARINPTM